MDGVILAGGLGIRLRPLTLTTPKCLVKVAEVPLIYHVIKFMKLDDICDRLIISAGYLGDKVVEYFKENAHQFNCNIEVYVERTALGTGGSLREIFDHYGLENGLVIYGDTLLSIDTEKFVEDISDDALALVNGIQLDDVSRFGEIIYDPSTNKLVKFVEKSGDHRSGIISAGLLYIKRELLDYAPDVPNYSLAGESIPIALKLGKLIKVHVSDYTYFSDVANESELLKVNKDVRQLLRN